jgi:RNA polymerase sigma factor (sigma-70 family)
MERIAGRRGPAFAPFRRGALPGPIEQAARVVLRWPRPLPPPRGGLARPAGPDAAEGLDRRQALHEAVERLPAELREVFGLTFYHDWTQGQIAGLLGVSPRQVRRRWRDACRRLH